MVNISDVELAYSTEQPEKLGQSDQPMLVSVTVRNHLLYYTLQKLTTENFYMDVTNELVDQFRDDFKNQLSEINIKIRRLSTKERLIFELAS